MSDAQLDYKVRLEVFEGPLDLLLYLIKKEEIEVEDIPISRITEQYLQYLDLMRDLNLDVAGEFILMAATLAHIKSRELLPKDPTAAPEAEDEGDPRAELVRRLLEYQKYKAVADDLSARPVLGRDTFAKGEANIPTREELKADAQNASDEAPLEVSLFALIDAFKRVIERIPPKTFHEVKGEEISVADKARWLATSLHVKGSLAFHEMFEGQDGLAPRKVDVVATFLALLELVRMKLIAITQSLNHGSITIRSKIPEGVDVGAIITGADLEQAFAYKMPEQKKTEEGAPPEPAPQTTAEADEEETDGDE